MWWWLDDCEARGVGDRGPEGRRRQRRALVRREEGRRLQRLREEGRRLRRAQGGRLQRRGHTVVVLSTTGELWADALGELEVRDLSFVDMPWRYADPAATRVPI